MGRDEDDKVKLSVGEAKARLLEYGHRPRGPKAAIRRDPVTAAAVAFFTGVVISRFRPGPMVPVGALLSKPVVKRLLPILGRVVVSRITSQVQGKGKGKPKRRGAPTGPQHRPYQPSPFGPSPRDAAGPVPGASRTEWAAGPQREGFSPPRARSQPPQAHRS